MMISGSGSSSSSSSSSSTMQRRVSFILVQVLVLSTAELSSASEAEIVDFAAGLGEMEVAALDGLDGRLTRMISDEGEVLQRTIRASTVERDLLNRTESFESFPQFGFGGGIPPDFADVNDASIIVVLVFVFIRQRGRVSPTIRQVEQYISL